MAIICRDHGLLFIQAPRTGCTAVARILKERFGGEQLPAKDIVGPDGFFQVPLKHCSADQLVAQHLIPEDYHSKLMTFVTVRNPFDSLVSLYVKKREKYQPLLADKTSWIYRVPGYVEDMEFCRMHSFEQWVDRHYAVGPVDKMLGRGRRSLYGKYTRGVRMIMRFERLQQDFEHVMRSAGITDDLVIPMFNPTPNRETRYQGYYTRKTRTLIEYVFQPDLEGYGYSFDGFDANAPSPVVRAES